MKSKRLLLGMNKVTLCDLGYGRIHLIFPLLRGPLPTPTQSSLYGQATKAPKPEHQRARMTRTDTNDRTTAAHWFERWQALIRHALSGRLSRSEDVDDMAQEVYLRLLRARRLDLVRSPRSYLYRVAVNVAEEWRLRAPQAKEHLSEPLESMTSADDPAEAMRQAERDRAVRRALELLPLASRTALVLHTRDGMTYEQIAAHMGVTRRAVKRYVAAGYAALRDELQAFRAERRAKDDKVHGER